MTDAQTKAFSDEDLKVFDLVNEEYRFYKEDVTKVLNDTLLLYDCVPDGMLGDIRDCFGHICDAVTRTDQPLEKRCSNIDNAHRHLRRFILDCYKLQCIWYRRQLHAFDNKYRWSNLSDVRDGQFRSEYTRLKTVARSTFRKAQKMERPGNNDRVEELGHLEDVYALYENALTDYIDTLLYVENALPAVERVAHKDVRRTVISVLGWIIGIGMTIAMTVVSIILTKQ